MTELGDETQARVRDRYAAAARAVDASGTTGFITPDEHDTFGVGLYGREADEAPAAAAGASLGCGNPLAVAELCEGETVLDLGSGGGLDVILSARRVGATGRAIGLDMTDEMLALARRNASDAGLGNVEFLRGTIESVPLPDAAVDVVISNCVITLSQNKPAVFAEIARVLRPGGRVGISDLIADHELSDTERTAAQAAGDCLATAITGRQYVDMLLAAGLTEADVEVTHRAGPSSQAAIIRARKPIAT
jgi:SAM-dependent methyltransferase